MSLSTGDNEGLDSATKSPWTGIPARISDMMSGTRGFYKGGQLQMVANNSEIEKRLWSAADELRANSRLKSSEYSVPVLGLIFLRYVDQKFTQAQQELAGRSTGRRTISKADYQAMGMPRVREEIEEGSHEDTPHVDWE